MNYRSILWKKEHAKETIEKLFAYTDVCIVNENQAYELFGVKGREDISDFADKYAFSHVAMTYRRTKDAMHNKIWSDLYTGGGFYKSREYEMEMADRIGGGDAYAAGLIYALGHSYEIQHAVEFAEAASCLKHSIIE